MEIRPDPFSVLVATTNANKLREIRPLLASVPVKLLTLAELPPLPEAAETAATFWENARQKAFSYAAATGQVVVAEDSGLEIEALDGQPGVQSARFLGPAVDYPTRFAEIYRRLGLANHRSRNARFVTAIAVVSGNGIVFETEAFIDGIIAPHPAGQHGFGYDPIFYYPPLGKTTGELTLEEKSAVSHRARAFRDLARWLRHTELT